MKNGTVQTASLDSDLNRLVSIVRERESSLVILLEEKQQRQWERPEWLLKECEYQQKEARLSRQIRSIVLRWVLIGDQGEGEQRARQVRLFWVKIKMVMKMSLERIKLLNLLNFQLFNQYQTIIDSINQGYDRAAGITHYRDIEEMIRNRNRSIHDLLALAIPLQSHRPKLEQILKHSIKQFPSDSKINHRLPSKTKELTLQPKAMRRPLSHQGVKHPLGKEFLLSRKIKRIEKFIGSYEYKVRDLMGAKLELVLDRKKKLQQNIEVNIENAMQKNIANHKTISKFIFSHSGRVPKRFLSKKHIKTASKKLIELVKPHKEGNKKKLKIVLEYDRAVSAKLKRKEVKEMKLRYSQVLDQGRLRRKIR